MVANAFDDFAEVYETMIDWPRRLATEAPFYRHWFQQVNAQSVLDVACGTGRHAGMFAEWGLRVEGRDHSAEMLARARASQGGSPRLQWRVRGFEEPPVDSEPFDAAICVGNSLALAPDVPTVAAALASLLHAVRGGGVAIVHLLNLWRLPDGPCVWQKCQRARIRDRDTLIIKGVHRSVECGFVELIVAPLDDPAAVQTESVSFLGLEADWLQQAAQGGGAADVEFFGDYRQTPYQRTQSTDLIMVARKPAASPSP